MSGAIPPLPNTSPWRGAQLKHRDFTFYLLSPSYVHFMHLLQTTDTKIVVSWVGAQCSVVAGYQFFGGPCCFYSTLKMEAARSYWYTTTTLNGLTTQKPTISIFTAVKTSNVTIGNNVIHMKLVFPGIRCSHLHTQAYWATSRDGIGSLRSSFPEHDDWRYLAYIQAAFESNKQCPHVFEIQRMQFELSRVVSSCLWTWWLPHSRVSDQ
jgi:hypothetical protein